jgi:hypothetical protein
MIFDTSRSPSRPTDITSTLPPSGPVLNPSSGSEQAQPDGLETRQSTLQTEGFSNHVIGMILQSRASSTLTGYNAKWNIFVCWCHKNHMDPHSTTVTYICDFLQWKLYKELQWQTKGYVADISACHKSFAVHSLGKDKWIIRFLKGSPRDRPLVNQFVLTWDLHVVLQALTDTPFEPIGMAF